LSGGSINVVGMLHLSNMSTAMSHLGVISKEYHLDVLVLVLSKDIGVVANLSEHKIDFDFCRLTYSYTAYFAKSIDNGLAQE